MSNKIPTKLSNPNISSKIPGLDGISNTNKTWDLSKNQFILKPDWWKKWKDGIKIPKLPSVSLGMPTGALLVGSFVEIPVNLHILTFDELDFNIVDGSKAGQISYSREADWGIGKPPSIMLCAGYVPGTYKIEVVKKIDPGVVIATGEFTTISEWTDEESGPNLHIEGVIKHDFVNGAAWGGGGTAVQNYNVTPHNGDWKMCMIMVDCAEERYPAADAPTISNQWMDEAINGVTQPDGTVRSVKKYYEEVSNGGLNVQADIFGPVNLDGNFSDWIADDGSAKGGFVQAVVTAIDDSINFSQYNTIVFIFRSVLNAPAPATPKRTWAWAWGQSFTSGEGAQTKACLIMPHDWQNHPDSGRQIHETLVHELGHNLSMGDLYSPTVTGRNMGNWEPMAFEAGLPSLSLYHLLRQGWVDGAWVKGYNFESMAAPVDEVVTLHALEAGTPPAGRVSGVEIRIANGWNYYFEYKRGQVGEINSQSLPAQRVVLGTDGVSGDFTPPFERPGVMLLPTDNEGDGQVITTGTDYKETDITDPAFPTDFKVSVVSEDGTKADLRVQYGVNSKPDPSIRPWPASDDRQWQSPDIEVKNVRNATNPEWFNVPWVNNDNTVVAKVRNNGSLDAPAVRVNFAVKNYNIGGSPEVLIGSDIKDIPAGATVEFQTNWRPPSEGHFCMVVRIPLYQVGGTGVVEMTELNNLAQSNYNRFLTGEASPFSREISNIEVTNPYSDRDARVFVIPTQSNPFYRTYLEHTWLRLKAGETRKVRMMMERMQFNELPMDLGYYQKNKQQIREGFKKPQVNRVSLLALIDGDTEAMHHTMTILGGLEAEVASGKSTRFESFEQKENMVFGRIVTKGDGKGVPGGKAIIKQTIDKLNQHGEPELVYTEFEVSNDGSFRGQLRDLDFKFIQAYYSPIAEFTDCWSEIITK